MRVEEVALLQLKRRAGRAVFILAGLAVGVATAVALLSLIAALEKSIQHKLDKYGANILVTPKTESLSLAYEGLALGGVSFELSEIKETDLDKIKSIKNAANLAAVGPLLLGPVKVKERPVLLAGATLSQSRVLKPWWKVKGAWPGPEELLVGAQAAKVLGLAQGDQVELGGRRLTVAGELEPTGAQDDSLLIAPLSTAQAILNKPGRVSLVEVAALCSECPIEDMVEQIGAALPGAKVMAIQQVVKGRLETLGHFRRVFYGVSALVILVGGLVVLVTMMGAVRERRSDIGLFRAVGFRQSQIVRLILTETFVVSTLAGLAGAGAGFGAAALALPYLAEGGRHGLVFDPALAGASLGLALVVGLLASLYPALLAARQDPSEALRAL